MCGVLCVLLLRAVRGVLCVVLYVLLVTRYVCVCVARTAVCCVRSFYMLYAIGCVCVCGTHCGVLRAVLLHAVCDWLCVLYCMWCDVCGVPPASPCRGFNQGPGSVLCVVCCLWSFHVLCGCVCVCVQTCVEGRYKDS